MNKIKQFIKKKEYNVVFKGKVNFKDPKEYLQIISIVTNGAMGGYIVFGVDENTNELIGIRQVKKSYEEISKNVKVAIETNMQANIKIVHIEEKNIILVEIVSKGGLISMRTTIK